MDRCPDTEPGRSARRSLAGFGTKAGEIRSTEVESPRRAQPTGRTSAAPPDPPAGRCGRRGRRLRRTNLTRRTGPSWPRRCHGRPRPGRLRFLRRGPAGMTRAAATPTTVPTRLLPRQLDGDGREPNRSRGAESWPAPPSAASVWPGLLEHTSVGTRGQAPARPASGRPSLARLARLLGITTA